MATMLHPALRLLLSMELKAGWRRFLRSAKTGKGRLRLLVTVGILTLTFAPMIAISFFREPPDAAAARAVVEPAMLLFTILTLMGSGPDNGIFFTPSEVDFLFPGPFQRRQLLLYRLAHQLRAALVGALFLSVAPAAFVPHWLFSYLGLVLVLQFIQLVSILLSLTTSLIGQSAYTRVRKAALVILGILSAAGVAKIVANQSATSLFGLVRQLTQSPGGRWVLMPFQVFSRTIAAERLFPDFLVWGAVALLVNVVLAMVALRLDSDFYERSIAISGRVALAMERARRGQAFMGLSKPAATRWRFPPPRRLRGAGPIAWHQAVSALRGSRSVLYVVLALVAGSAFFASVLKQGSSGFSMGALTFLSLFLLPQMLQFDFRGDIERIDFLKALPASAFAIAAGELIVPVVFATIIEWVLILSTGALQADWRLALIACAFAPAANLILFSLENLFILHYPRRSVSGTPFQAPARQMLMNFVKFLGIGAAGTATAFAGFLGYWIFQGSFAAAFSIAWGIAAAIGLSLVPFVARAFRGLDPSIETLE